MAGRPAVSGSRARPGKIGRPSGGNRRRRTRPARFEAVLVRPERQNRGHGERGAVEAAGGFRWQTGLVEARAVQPHRLAGDAPLAKILLAEGGRMRRSLLHAMAKHLEGRRGRGGCRKRRCQQQNTGERSADKAEGPVKPSILLPRCCQTRCLSIPPSILKDSFIRTIRWRDRRCPPAGMKLFQNYADSRHETVWFSLSRAYAVILSRPARLLAFGFERILASRIA